MNRKKEMCLFSLSSLILLSISGCGQVSSSGATVPEGWTDETHGNNVDPNYDIVFPQDKVNQLKITITPDDWGAMQENMTELFGEPRSGQPGAGPHPGNMPERNDEIPGPRNMPQVGGIGDMATENPIWVPATIEFDGNTWTNVGVRYKGNSSLRSGWSSGTIKLPLKLDFDEFEDEYPEINNQRFYGFKQLSLSNAFHDSTYMRDAIAADILTEAGLPAAETAYYEVILDYGEGPVNLGLYVAIEVIDDTVIDRFFGDDSGNIYEADGQGVSLAQGSFSQIENSFLKENNLEEADWSDIEELYTVLHSEERTSAPEAWRQSLEAVFNVDVFLEWLAISAIIQHWDTYGSMSHNFYLYHDPGTGLVTWISWDHNEVLGVGGGNERGGAGLPGRGVRGSVSLGKEEVGQDWPLIRFLLDDPVYQDRYLGYIAETINGPFDPEQLETRCWALSDLIEPYVAESDKANFDPAVQQLIDQIYERFQVAKNFLETGE